VNINADIEPDFSDCLEIFDEINDKLLCSDLAIKHENVLENMSTTLKEYMPIKSSLKNNSILENNGKLIVSSAVETFDGIKTMNGLFSEQFDFLERAITFNFQNDEETSFTFKITITKKAMFSAIVCLLISIFLIYELSYVFSATLFSSKSMAEVGISKQKLVTETFDSLIKPNSNNKPLIILSKLKSMFTASQVHQKKLELKTGFKYLTIAAKDAIVGVAKKTPGLAKKFALEVKKRFQALELEKIDYVALFKSSVAKLHRGLKKIVALATAVFIWSKLVYETARDVVIKKIDKLNEKKQTIAH
jgi:hypothetical protein